MSVTSKLIIGSAPAGLANDSPFQIHGGRLAAARVRYPDAALPWLDLSTGICPWPYPIPALDVECWSRLPDPEALEQLLDAARETYDAPLNADVIAAAGSDLIIALLPRLVQTPCCVAVVSPTYASHERAWTAAGHRVRRISAANDDVADCTVVVVVNPNNPDGRVWHPDELRAIAVDLSSRGGLLIVDEAFADVAPSVSYLTKGSDLSHTLVLRSFGKFYGLAGLRLGFAITEHRISRALSDCLGGWPVSGPAIAIGAQALRDGAWARATRERLAYSVRTLDRIITAAGLPEATGTALFRYTETSGAEAVFERLARSGILVRPFANTRGLRFGIPGAPEDFERLAAALAG